MSDSQQSNSAAGGTIEALSRETALLLLHVEVRKYIEEQYDGDLDKRGLKLELQQMGDSVGHTLRWSVQQLGLDLDDVRILLMLAWCECTQEDFDHFYDVVEEG